MKTENFKIPKQIQLMCRTIDIVYEADLGDKHDLCGAARYRQDQIAIQKKVEGCEERFNHQVETYFHELIHWVFTMLEETELNANEALIEKMGKLLAQAALSAEYK